MVNFDNDMFGILGGTFNPPHIGHLILAQDALEKFGLSSLVFMPCAIPPHKHQSGLAAADHRFAMLEAAIAGEPFMSVSDIEIKRGGTSFAIDTVRQIRQTQSGKPVFIIGSDSLKELHLWRSVSDLLEMCEFRVFARPGYPADDLSQTDLRLPSPWGERMLANCATGHLIDVSSSEIRRRVAEGMSIRYLVHPAVEMYISEHRLYLA